MSNAMAETYTGSCNCGAVTIEASGEPLDMGYCHCDGCRAYTGAPIALFTLWKPEAVKITKGAESLGRFKSSEISERRFCTKCGAHVMVDHPTLGLTDIRTPLNGFTFKATVHLNYEDTVLRVKDGLPKLKDFPAAIGGSGASMPE
ncbi:MAG: hypothetical protein QOK24_1322 [Verrucomicrobiota bacterium]|jgi:hypothetical protein